jgi:putative DNA primase/helicase
VIVCRAPDWRRSPSSWISAAVGPQLLHDIAEALLDHIVLTRCQADTIALYAVYTHGFETWRIAPRLGFRAAGKGCGKSETLRRMKRLVACPVACENLTAPVLFRLTETARPTLLLDELDNLLTEDKSAVLGVMNSGYARDGAVFRCVGDQNELRAFQTFS